MRKTTAELRVEQALEAIRDRIPFVPQVAAVLGSGLGAVAEQIPQEAVIGYEEIPGFPVSTVPGHRGQFVFGYADGVPVVLMQGRVHFYEGYTTEEVVLPIRLMRRMGAETLILTNAAGGLNPAFAPGDLMMITDQITSFLPSPLTGPNAESFGTRFPDMSHIYAPALQDVLRETAAGMELTLREGVYVQTTGPQYETPAEVRMLRMLGADAVGMSTCVEAVAAVHAGMQVCGISCITNYAAGIMDTPLSHTEVQIATEKAGPVFSAFLLRVIGKLSGG